MLKITVDEDCGNAPKKLLLKEFYIALAKNDLPFISGNLSEDVTRIVPGGKPARGKEKVVAEMEQTGQRATTELVINNIITHGNNATANGLLKFPDGKRYAFCDVYKFGLANKETKIKEITSYGIELKNNYRTLCGK